MPDETLDALYTRGDFAALRRTATSILADPASDGAARGCAQRYLARISVDGHILATLGFALLFFCAIVVRYGLF